ncbi:MAG: DUF3800 domain-containing protein [Desulfurococcales archaeon]|nr:DUF3800 domain-containing protein [Desulfurococcales archaeon]
MNMGATILPQLEGCGGSLYLVFMDESGADGEEQRFFVLSAILVPASCYIKEAEHFKEEYPNIVADLPKHVQNSFKSDNRKLGEGFEIKFSKAYKTLRGHPGFSRILRPFMEFPKRCSGCAILVVGDKEIFKTNRPKLPPEIEMLEDENDKFYAYGFRLMLERIQWFLKDDVDGWGIIIYDLNMFEEAFSEIFGKLKYEGAEIFNLTLESYFVLKFDRIHTITYARSENCLGLQIADFYAGITYRYKKGEISENNWRSLVWNNLRKRKGKIIGYGYKEYPEVRE